MRPNSEKAGVALSLLHPYATAEQVGHEVAPALKVDDAFQRILYAHRPTQVSLILGQPGARSAAPPDSA